ncbi:hypothetical protein [Actinopolymorpha alba]|uniref:hypothetical protein n=1 Tax=Actinopolymorpha alba TaxID=533267 RepID=UPI0003651B0B|nr:hypothetical protein [Actinopolymorpha alba]
MAIDVEAARTFIRTNARILERRLAEFHLDHDLGAGAAALEGLNAYQNADGGFGHGLEPDVRAPDSQPLFVDFATELLDDLVSTAPRFRAGARERAAMTIPFLRSVTSTAGGLPIVLPSITAHPRAAHWGDANFPAGLNPTASIVGRLRAFGIEDSWVDEAATFCWTQLEAPDSVTDAHTALCVLRFLETEPDRERAERSYAAIGSRFDELGLFLPMPGEGYGLTPLHIAPTPDSPRRGFFSDAAIAAHLEALKAAQQPDGGWPISWEPPGPAAELEWRSIETLRVLRVLTAYAS